MDKVKLKNPPQEKNRQICQKTGEISRMSRNTQGVTLMRMYNDGVVVSVAKARQEEDDEDDESINDAENEEADIENGNVHVDDIVEGIERLINNPPSDSGEVAQHKVYNIGNNNPEKLMVFIETLEKALSNSLGREVVFGKIFEPIKPGDVPATFASTDLLQKAVGFKPETSIELIAMLGDVDV